MLSSDFEPCYVLLFETVFPVISNKLVLFTLVCVTWELITDGNDTCR